MTSQPPPPPPGYLRVNVQGNRLLTMITPSVQVNGYPVPMRFGPNVVPMPPGVHTVSAHAQWMWRYGQASQQVQLAPGQTVDVFYAAPVLTFMSGAMGFTKQRVPGMLAFVLLLVVLLLVVIGLPVAVILATA
ncbi:hypothetical protein KVF89_00175 [Nocardioides carbamazepini]|uniref:hypothetical protein n=1 Tax=Nocardioides carbamazepini TaxID=2854259 RepID=UPI00214A5B3D|nr:hypothetical protein [Nocardioides carbamazepini]MCR1780934.1 hypothetical protein [Nocardioides carbamazepini]